MFVTMFLSLFCGSIVDKCSRKGLIVGIDTIQGILILTVGVLAYTNALNIPIVLLAALLAAFRSVLCSPAISTLIIDILPRNDINPPFGHLVSDPPGGHSMQRRYGGILQ